MNSSEIKASFRNLRKDRLTSLINLGGLAIGMTCCMLIILYIRDELGYNRFNTRLKDIYRVNWISKANGQVQRQSTAPVALGPAIASEVSQVRAVARMYQRGGEMRTSPTGEGGEVRKFHEANVYMADNALFSIFSVPFLEGDPATALKLPGKVVITDEMARKYFGTADPMGKTLFYDNKALLEVSGVIRRMPDNADYTWDFLISFETLFALETPAMTDFLKTNWLFNPATTWCLVAPGQRPETINREINGLLTRYADSRTRELTSLEIQPLADIHLKAADITGNPSTDSMAYLSIFAGIALLILLIANLNFINLSIARATTRSKEVSMRKVLGADKRQLIRQFLGEHLLLCALAFVLSWLLASACMPLLNELTGKQFSPLAWCNPAVLGLCCCLFLCTGISAGLYPAFFMTRFNPVTSLKGKSGEATHKNTGRKLLLTIQFAISIVLVIGAIVIYRQLQYLRNKPLGFQKEQILTIPLFGSGASSVDYSVDGPMRARMNSFTNELLKFSRIEAATAASALPGQSIVMGLVIPQGFTGKDNIFVPWISVDYNFDPTFRIPIVAGRDFSKSTGTDHLNAFILNESAVRSFGWKNPGEVIGKTIIRGDEQHGKRGQVIGVIRDFNFNTLDQPMQPLILDVNAPRFTQFAIRIQADHVPQTIAYVHAQWDRFFPERVFESSFLDKDISALYNDKERLSTLIAYFACIATLLSVVGLFSLTLFLTVQRTREIGIRKVLGAGVADIVALLSLDFLRLTAIAFVIAAPIAWYCMNRWLEQYAYRISVEWWVFALTGGAGLVITALTVGFQALRAALANPVGNLRAE